MSKSEGSLARKVPRRSSMSDLSGLFRKNILTLILSHFFTGAGPKSVQASILLRSYVRVVDKALEDYELSRLVFLEFVNRTSNNTLSPFFRAIGHMENCLTSVCRALKFANRMVEDKELQAEISELEVMRSSNQKRVTTIRNTTEHLDDRVIRDKIGAGDLSTLWMGEDHIELEGVQITYSELGTWLGELHSLAVNLAKFRPR